MMYFVLLGCIMVLDIVIFRLAVVYLSDLDGTMIALNFWEGLHVGKLPLYMYIYVRVK